MVDEIPDAPTSARSSPCSCDRHLHTYRPIDLVFSNVHINTSGFWDGFAAAQRYHADPGVISNDQALVVRCVAVHGVL